MSLNHKLSLESLDTLNRTILKLTDTSHYNPNIAIENAKLEILLPGFRVPVIKEVTPGFNLVLNACDLNIQKEDCDSKSFNLPDGIYAIRYSVAPNDYVQVSYNYLKVSELMSRYKEALCCLELDAHEPESEKKEKIKQLFYVKMYIEAAKAKAEECAEPKKSMELYNYAKKILSKFDCIKCR